MKNQKHLKLRVLSILSHFEDLFCISHPLAIVEPSRFPTAEQTYGEDVEVIVQDEDELDQSQPLMQPKETKVFDYSIEDAEKNPETTFSKDFLFGMTKQPHAIRNFCFVGPIHSGKTSIVDMFIRATHVKPQPVCFHHYCTFLNHLLSFSLFPLSETVL